MKSLAKYYLLPFSILIILNALLFLYVYNYQKNTSDEIQALDTTSDEFFSMVLEAEVHLDRLVLSGSKADSASLDSLLSEIDLQARITANIYSRQESLSTSMLTLADRYSKGLDTYKENFYESDLDESNELIRSKSRLQVLQVELQNVLKQLNQQKKEALDSRINEAENVFSYLFIIYLVIILLLLVIAYRFFVRPLYLLKKEILKMSDGAYGQIEFERDDEIGELVKAFNVTSASLKESEEKLRRSTKRLMLTNKELEAFAYSVSHDLRSPLRSISGFSEALVNNYADDLPEKAQDYLNRVDVAAQKMGELIDDILKLSRIGRKEITKKRINVTELAHEIIQLTITKEEKEYTFEVEEDLIVYADKGLTKILMLNLLSNAIKFSRAEDRPTIKVGSITKDGSTYVFVSDNGIGLDMKYEDKIFGAFQRLHSKNEFKGTGIGLTTVKRIVNKHGGDIFIESKTGEGTTIYFNLGT